MRSEGIFFCPICFCKREFVPTEDAASGDPYPPMECIVCTYTFYKTSQEDPAGGPTQTIDTVSQELRDQARRQVVKEFSMQVAHNWRLRQIDRKILFDD